MLVFWDASAHCAALLLVVAYQYLRHVFYVHEVHQHLTRPTFSSCLSHLVLLIRPEMQLQDCDRPLAKIHKARIALLGLALC